MTLFGNNSIKWSKFTSQNILLFTSLIKLYNPKMNNNISFLLEEEKKNIIKYIKNHLNLKIIIKLLSNSFPKGNLKLNSEYEDEVLLPAPYWVSYSAIAILCEAKFVEVPSSIDTDFKITPEQLEAAITPKTKKIASDLIYSKGPGSSGAFSFSGIFRLFCA